MILLYKWDICLILCLSMTSISLGGDLVLGIILLVSNSTQYNSTEAMRAVQETLLEVNDRTDLLPNITLEITSIVESTCVVSATTAYTIFSTVSLSDTPIIALLNAGCPSTMDSLTHIEELARLSMLSLSPGASSITATGGNSIGLFPNPLSTISVLVSIIQLNEWKRMSLVTSTDGIIYEQYKSLFTELENSNIALVDTVVILPDSDLTNILTFSNLIYFKNLSSRIVFLDVDEITATEILCEAYKRKIYYPFYEWILHGWYRNDWLMQASNHSSCSSEEYFQVVERAIVIQEYQEDSGTKDISISAGCSQDMPDQGLSFVPSLAHDAVYALALAMNQSVTNNVNHITDCLTSKEGFMVRQLSEIHFNGKSGQVMFDDSGDRILQKSKLFQYRSESDCISLVNFADAHLSNNNTYNIALLANESDATIWPGGIPFDGSPLVDFITITVTAIVPIYVMATIGNIFAVVCLIFTIIFRNKKVIRLTSPNLNYCIDAGAMIMYSSLYIRMLPSVDIAVWKFMCPGLVWTNMIGFVLCFSPVFAKVWRIYYIFKNPTKTKKSVKDIYLLMIVLVILLGALFLLILGTFIPGIKPEPYYTPNLDDPFSENKYGIRVDHLAVNCFTFLSFSWVIFLSVCLFFVEVGALVLAIKTRKIKIRVLNDSKEISVIVYITTVASLEASIVAVTLQGFHTLSEALLSATFFVIATTILGLVHIPKMRSLYKDPKGEKVFSNGINGAAANQSSLGSLPNIFEKVKITALEKRIASLEELLQQNNLENSTSSAVATQA